MTMREWPPVSSTGVVRLTATTQRGTLLVTTRDEPIAPVCSPHVRLMGGRFTHQMAVTQLLEGAHDCDESVPTVPRDAIPKRIAEHTAGRYFAARALLAAGHPLHTLPPVGVGERQAPIWPAGFIGSITHAGERVVAACAASRGVFALGIDVERIMLSETAIELRGSVCTETELASLPGVGDRSRLALLLSLVFSAKESLFKALYPHVRRFFSFHDAEASALDLSGRTMNLRLLQDLGGPFGCGVTAAVRFAVEPPYLLTAVELPAVG